MAKKVLNTQADTFYVVLTKHFYVVLTKNALSGHVFARSA